MRRESRNSPGSSPRSSAAPSPKRRWSFEGRLSRLSYKVGSSVEVGVPPTRRFVRYPPDPTVSVRRRPRASTESTSSRVRIGHEWSTNSDSSRERHQFQRDNSSYSNSLRGSLIPRFSDHGLEAAYIADLDRRMAGRASRVVLPVLCFMAILYAVQFLVRGDPVSWLCRVLALVLSVFYGFYWLLLARWPSSGTQIGSYLTATFLYIIIVVSMTVDRWAKIMGLQDRDWEPTGAAMEAQCIALLCGALNISALFVRLSSGQCLLLVHAATVVYLVAVGTLGSVEHEVLTQQLGVGTLMVDHVILAAIFYITGVLTFTARRNQELLERDNFAKVHSLEMELAKKLDIERELWAHEKEVDQMFSAFDEACNLGSFAVESGHKNGSMSSDQVSVASMLLHVPRPGKLETLHLSQADSAPSRCLSAAMTGQKADWPKIRRMAAQMREPEYGLRQFFDDCVSSFPELTLFWDDGATRPSTTGSGRAADDEYQRTIGALFAVYWLLRLDLDGKESFCYGVDQQWKPLGPPAGAESVGDRLFVKMSSGEKRLHFLQDMPWSTFEDLVASAGCGPEAPNRTERIMALLCLTAFHDIMKVTELLPTVQPEHGSYMGYQAGQVIHDHDLALGYILERYPGLLPSFAGLSPEQQRSVSFTQGKMHFNHGWFVQAEAPPGAMLSGFKAALSSGATPEDVGFYFLHWFTDLAGAEATPLGGAEKFVLKFPHAVLGSFLWSMPFLGRLVNTTETDVFETYLQSCWRTWIPHQAVPEGKTAVAVMRLTLMAQAAHGSRAVLDAFEDLPRREQLVLSQELARTGIEGQCFAGNPITGGPALLVYYGPAFLQRHSSYIWDLQKSLRVLARVMHAARRLWPVSDDAVGATVTVQISELKGQPIEEIVTSPVSPALRNVWVLLRHSDLDGAVMLRTAAELDALIISGKPFCVLDFDLSGDSDKFESL